MRELKKVNSTDGYSNKSNVKGNENILTPKQIVEELDRYVVGQKEAKRMVAIALRNRWRRQQVSDDLKDEIAKLYKKVESKEIILSNAQKNVILALRQDYVEEQIEMAKKFMQKEIDVLKDKQLQLQR